MSETSKQYDAPINPELSHHRIPAIHGELSKPELNHYLRIAVHSRSYGDFLTAISHGADIRSICISSSKTIIELVKDKGTPSMQDWLKEYENSFNSSLVRT